MPKLDIPSRVDVEKAIEALFIEEEREKEAIRKFWARERRRPILSPRAIQAAIIVSLATVFLFVYAIFR